MTSEFEAQELENVSGDTSPQLTELEELAVDLRPYLARWPVTMSRELVRTLV
jgi:hypothetical protein